MRFALAEKYLKIKILKDENGEAPVDKTQYLVQITWLDELLQILLRLLALIAAFGADWLCKVLNK